MAVALLCHTQTYNFMPERVANMTLECVGEWMKHAELIVCGMKPDEPGKPGKPPPDTPERIAELLKKAKREQGIRIPRILHGRVH